MADNDFALLTARYADGLTTAEENEEIVRELKESPERRDEFVQMLCLQEHLHRKYSSQRAGDTIREAGAESRTRRPVMRWAWVSVAACIAIMVGAFVYNDWSARNSLGELVGHVKSTMPGVRIIRRGETIIAVADTEVLVGDVIKTGANQIATIRYPGEETEVDVLAESIVEFGDVRNGKRLRLEDGGIQARVDRQEAGKPMMIGTARAMAEVRGTVFLVAYYRDATLLKVSKGLVSITRLSDGRSVDVPAGHFATVREGQELAVIRWAFPDGLVGHWTFDEPDGDAVLDSSEMGNNAGMMNGPVRIPGVLDGAVQLDGEDDAIGMSPLPYSYVVNAFTMSAWVRPAAERDTTREGDGGMAGLKTAQRYVLFPTHGATYNSTDHVGAGLSVGTNGVSVFEHAEGHMPSVLVYDTPITGWTHIALVYDARTPTLYINGAPVRTGRRSRYVVHASVGMGGHPYGSYKGGIDDVRVYNRALSEAEVAALSAVRGSSQE